MTETTARMVGRLQHALVPAVPVTFRADGSIDEAAQERYAAWMLAQPVAGVAVWAHTGRGLHLTAPQRELVLRQWVEARADGKLVIAGVGAEPALDLPEAARSARYRDNALAMAEQALEGGADLLMAFAPAVYRGWPDQDRRIAEHVAALAELDAPLLLFYLYEAAGGINFSLELLRDLLAVPQVVGIKMATLDSVMTFQDVARLVGDEFPSMLLVTGEDRFLGYSLMCGATSALVGMGCACVEPQARLLQNWFDGHTLPFVQLSRFVDEFAQATFRAPMEGYVQRMLWCLADDGIVPEGSACDPFGPELPASQRELVRRRARALKSAG